MPTPYPSTGPGTPPSVDLIQVPDYILALSTEALGEFARVAYIRGYRTGWHNSSSQYTEEKDLSQTLDYLLRRWQEKDKGLTDAIVESIKKNVKKVLPKDYGGEP